MFDPYGDLTDVWKRVSGDAEIRALMGLSTANPTEVATAIVRTRDPGTLAGNHKRICVFKAPSRKSRSEVIPEQVVEIDCYVPLKEAHIAQKVMARVHVLLHRQRVGKCVFNFEGHLGDSPTTVGFYCDAIRFCHYSGI